MEQMRVQVNEIAFNQDLLGRSDAGDHGSVITQDTDRGYALRLFLRTTESVFSGSPPGSPGPIGNREGSVSPPPTTLKGQPPQIKRDLEGTNRRRNGGSRSVSSSSPHTLKTESRTIEGTRGGSIKAPSGGGDQTFSRGEDLGVLQPAQDQETRRGFSEDLPTPDDVMKKVATLHESEVPIHQADTGVDKLELKTIRQDRQRQYRRHQKRTLDLPEEKEGNLLYTSPLSLERETTFVDDNGDDDAEFDMYRSSRPKLLVRPPKSSGGLGEPKINAKPLHGQLTLSPIQESNPSGIPSYGSFFDEDHAGHSQDPSFSMEEDPVLPTKNKAPAPNAKEARVRTSDIQALMDHLTARDAQRKARDNEILMTLVPATATMPDHRKLHKPVTKHPSPTGIVSDKGGILQEIEEKLEVLKPTSDPISPPSDNSPLGYPSGDEPPDASEHNIQQRHSFDDNVGATQIVQERSSAIGSHTIVDSEQTGEFQGRIYSGDDVDFKATEKSTYRQYTLPDGGSPAIIATRREMTNKNGPSNKSQTSLLIEYFEGGKGSQAESRRPSVKVKVTPSSKSRSRPSTNQIQIAERKATSKSRRIQLPPSKSDKSPEGNINDNIVRSYRSASEESNVISRRGGPVEVEIMPRRHRSLSIQPEIASTQIREHHQRSGSYEEPHSPSTLNIPPTLQLDVRNDVQENNAGEARTHEPEIAALKRSSLNSSTNNSHVLETVEDAIRRLILPDWTALKNEQAARQERKQRGVDRLMGNNFDDDAPSKPRRRRRSKAQNQDAMDSSFIPPMPLMDSEGASLCRSSNKQNH
jgi:hypothetical protein